MGWASAVLGGLLLTLVLISIATTLAGFLLVTHQSCAASSTTTNSGFLLFGETSNSSSTTAGLNDTNSSAAAPSLLPVPVVPVVADDLSLAPLTSLSLTKGNSSATADLSNLTFWQQVQASEYQTYEEIVPQTVMGFFNSSEEWRDWAQQYIPDSGSWLAAGFVTDAQGRAMAVEPTSSGAESSTAVAQGIQEFAASAAGVTLASLDFVSLNGLTAFKTLFETGDATLAACQTLPGQLAQLYESSVDQTVPQDERAQYLGRALAITSVMLIVGGKDGFADGFQTAIDGLGLGDSWPAVKPYLGDIASKVSIGASSATFSILQTLAGRFPQDSVWATGLTADRVDAMVQVFKEDGLPNDFIQDEIQKVAQAASGSPNEDGAAGAADDASYQGGGWLKVSVRSQNRMSLYQDSTGRTEAITIKFLQDNVPGFDPTDANFIQISYKEADVAVYQYYGGPGDTADGVDPKDVTWTPKAPSDVAKQGTIATVKFSILTPDAFVNRMPLLQFDGFDLKAPWMTLASRVTSYTLSGDELRIGVTQAGFGLYVSDFEVDGADAALNWDGKMVSLDFQVVDAFGQPTEMRLVYNGYSNPQLRIVTGESDFAQVLLVSSDGVRLKFLYNTGPSSSSITTIYATVPSGLYSVADKIPGDAQYLASGGSAVYEIDSVTFTRSLETMMMNSGQTYDLGTLGAEIAYTVGTEQLGIQNLILHEPSEGGPDLNTVDKTVFVQARMLDLRQTPTNDISSAIQGQLPEMVDDLRTDFGHNTKTATMGYAIISYIDSQNTIKTIIVQVPYP